MNHIEHAIKSALDELDPMYHPQSSFVISSDLFPRIAHIVTSTGDRFRPWSLYGYPLVVDPNVAGFAVGHHRMWNVTNEAVVEISFEKVFKPTKIRETIISPAR